MKKNKIMHICHWAGMVTGLLGLIMAVITKKDFMWPLSTVFWAISSYMNLIISEKLESKK